MVIESTLPLADSIESLLSLWNKDRRSKGGWWALAGFSFQSAVYLTTFFQGLEEGSRSPADLAKTELLSDVFLPNKNKYSLIQVKRTLDRSKMQAALREAYDIAKLCSAELLTNIEFKIACIERQTPAQASDFSLEDIGGPDADADIWAHLLRCFDEYDSVIEQPDPLDNLRDFLWHSGVIDPTGFIDNCLGLLLKLFGNPDENTASELAYELNQKFQEARSSGFGPRSRVGLVLGPSDFAIDPSAENDSEILFNRRPTLHDFQLGRVRQRSELFAALDQVFADWWRAIAVSEDVQNIPTFWISGRSGEGKSVLLLQLAQHLVIGDDPPLVHFLDSANELPKWLENQREVQRNQSDLASLPTVAVVDDLHFVGDLDQWEVEVRGVTSIAPPRVVVLTCGPSTEKEVFQARVSTLFDVKTFSVPNLQRKEMRAFSEWVERRTGKKVSGELSQVENRLLVIWIFELLRGESLSSFADGFRRRLIALGLFEVARSILAANALELAGPTSLTDRLSDGQRDAFAALCAETQMHFRETGSQVDGSNGYHLSHPQINWQLYCEWSTPPATLAQNLGRDLVTSLLDAAKAEDWTLSRKIIFRLISTTRLNGEATPGLKNTLGTIDQALSELHRKLHQSLPVNEVLPILPGWLEAVFRGFKSDLNPDPITQALSAANSSPISANLPAAVGSWLWRISDLGCYEKTASELRCAARKILFSVPDAGFAVAVVVSQSKDRIPATNLALQWIGEKSADRKAYHALAPLVAARPDDPKVVSTALKWVKDNHEHPQAYQALAPLVAARPDDPKVVSTALKWVKDNHEHPQAYQALAPLVAAWPDDQDVLGAARDWIEKNPNSKNLHHLLITLVIRTDGNQEWIEQSENALQTAKDGPKRNLLAALMLGSNANHRYVELTLELIETETVAGKRIFLLRALGRCFANNIQSALLFLGGESSTERKMTATHELARALAQLPNRVEELLEKINEAPTEYTGLLLVACVRSDIADETLNPVLQRWLNSHFRKRGYGAVLRALKHLPERWSALKGNGGLQARILTDYERLS